MSTSRRQPDETRRRLLEAAFSEIHHNGFRSTSLDQILRATNVTKGALYHHFQNKKSLGLAVIDEMVRPWVETRWKPMLDSDRPLQTAIEFVKDHETSVDDELLRLGCPFGNLVQEMASIDESFSERLFDIFFEWKRGIAASVQKSQAVGEGRSDVDPDDVALVVIWAIEGMSAMAKASHCREHFAAGHRGLIQYLESMRA